MKFKDQMWLNSLKYFNEEANEYYIIAAGSLLGVALNNLKSFHEILPHTIMIFLNMPPLMLRFDFDKLGI